MILLQYARKPGIGRFYNNVNSKVGKQSIQNRLAFMDEVQEEWTFQLELDDALKTFLKKIFSDFD